MSPCEPRGSSWPHPWGMSRGRQLQASCGVWSGRGELLGYPAGSQAGGLLSCLLAPGPLPTSGGQLAQLGRVEVTCLEVARASICFSLPLPAAFHSATMPGTPPTFCAISPLPSHSLSLTPSVSPWVPGSCLSGPGSPRPGAGLCKCGISRVSSAGLPAWLTFNLIRGGASAEPLIKAGRQLGECQGGLGPRG